MFGFQRSCRSIPPTCPEPDLPGSYLLNGFMFRCSPGPDAPLPGCCFSSRWLSFSAVREFRLRITGNRKKQRVNRRKSTEVTRLKHEPDSGKEAVRLTDDSWLKAGNGRSGVPAELAQISAESSWSDVQAEAANERAVFTPRDFSVLRPRSPGKRRNNEFQNKTG